MNVRYATFANINILQRTVLQQKIWGEVGYLLIIVQQFSKSGRRSKNNANR